MIDHRPAVGMYQQTWTLCVGGPFPPPVDKVINQGHESGRNRYDNTIKDVIQEPGQKHLN